MTKLQQQELARLTTATPDERVVDPISRDYLVKSGYVQRRFGWNVATPWGASVAANLKLIES